MGRATNAAARVFLTRDDSGRERVNTSYFVRALTAVAPNTASRPYWRRSATGPVSDLGSTMGNDAGMNLLHEFQPGIEHLMKTHTPRFVLKMIGERVSPQLSAKLRTDASALSLADRLRQTFFLFPHFSLNFPQQGSRCAPRLPWSQANLWQSNLPRGTRAAKRWLARGRCASIPGRGE